MAVLDRKKKSTYRIDGVIGDYLKACTDQWLMPAPFADPGMLEIMRDRDRTPHRNLVPWAGEFAGKYLTAAVQTLRLTDDEELRTMLKGFVKELVSLQEDDGYLGPWPREKRLTNEGTWDTWGHYHIMVGLLLWHEDTGDRKALHCARRMGDLICEKYAPGATPALAETGSTEMNLAPAHGLCLLHRRTKEQKYLDAAVRIVEEEFSRRDDTGAHLAGDYLEGPLKGAMFFELPRPRWESLHPVMALAELYDLTGDERCREAFVRIWRSITVTDRHNNGGFTSGERATGDPFHRGAIETCCTIAWIALTVEMLRLTGDTAAADELELATFNSVTGMHSASGRWATYDTPMDGVRRASAHSIVFQSREGTPELNCCSVNSVRGFGMISDWAVMTGDDGVTLNFWGPSSMTVPLSGKTSLTLEQKTTYPYDGKVSLAVTPSKKSAFVLRLRIPRWSRKTTVAVNGERVSGVVPGAYLLLEREWKKGDTVEIRFDMSLSFHVGRRACAGKVSIYRGPLLLTWDRRYNDHAPGEIPELDVENLKSRKAKWSSWLPPRLLLEFTAKDGSPVRLCDFDSAGRGGSPYASWLPAETDGVDLFEPWSPSEVEYERAELGILAADWNHYLARRPRPGMDPNRVIGMLRAMQRRLPALRKLVASVRERIETDPDGDGVAQLREGLALLEEAGLADPDFGDRLLEEEACFRAERDLPLPVRDVTATAPQPPCAVEDVAFPNVPFTEEPHITDEQFIDVRRIHGGEPGVIHVRGAVRMDSAGAGRLVFGADGPVKAWVNGSEVAVVADAVCPAAVDEYRAPVDLREGENEIVLAVDTRDGKTWGVFAGLLKIG